MSVSSPPYGNWTHEETKEQHKFGWHQTFVAERYRAFAVINFPAALQGTMAVSGWSNDIQTRNNILDNSLMTTEAEKFAEQIEFKTPESMERPCHVEMQLITYYINYVEQYPCAVDYAQSKQANKNISASERLDISVSMKVCNACHEFAILTYWKKGLEINFFVKNKRDNPECEACGAIVIRGYWSRKCEKCQLASLKGTKFLQHPENLSLEDLPNLRHAVKLYIRNTPADRRHLELDVEYAVHHYSIFREFVLQYLEDKHENEDLTYLRGVDWKFRVQCISNNNAGGSVDDQPTSEAGKASSSAEFEALSDGLGDSSSEVEPMNTLTEKFSGVSLGYPHHAREIYGFPSTDSEEEAEMLQENTNTLMEKALDDNIYR